MRDVFRAIRKDHALGERRMNEIIGDVPARKAPLMPLPGVGVARS